MLEAINGISVPTVGKGTQMGPGFPLNKHTHTCAAVSFDCLWAHPPGSRSFLATSRFAVRRLQRLRRSATVFRTRSLDAAGGARCRCSEMMDSTHVPGFGGTSTWGWFNRGRRDRMKAGDSGR